MGRKSDGEPGVKTLWRGIQRLNDLAAMWQILASFLMRDGITYGSVANRLPTSIVFFYGQKYFKGDTSMNCRWLWCISYQEG